MDIRTILRPIYYQKYGVFTPIKKVLNLHVIQSDPSYVGLSNIGYEIQSHPGEAIGGGWGIIH